MDAGLVGGIIGSIVGVIGAGLGTYFSVKNTTGPKQRAFMIRTAVVCWVAVLTFVGLLLILPAPYKYALWIVYAFLIFWGTTTINKRLSELNDSE